MNRLIKIVMWIGRLLFGSFLGMQLAYSTPLQKISIVGEWEVVRVLVPDGFSNSQLLMQRDDTSVMGRIFRFEKNSSTFANNKKLCALDESVATKTFSIKSLFADEKFAAPSVIRDRFYKRQRDYELGALANQRVTIFSYRCEQTASGDNVRLNNSGNWFAATSDMVIWPLAPDALVLLKRPLTSQSPDQKKFCASANQLSDQLICTDREMWSMRQFSEQVRRCSKNEDQLTRQFVDSAFANVERKLSACASDKSCVYSALDEHVGNLAQRYRVKPECSNR